MRKFIIVLLCCLWFGIEACAEEKRESANANVPSGNSNVTAEQAEKGAQNEAPKMETSAPKLMPHRVWLGGKKYITLNVPDDFDIRLSADGFKRPRFMVKSPDNRIFLTTMFNRTDNRKGAIYILDGFDAKTGNFKTITPYLNNLRNPNSVAFYRDNAGQHWLYVALTDRLIRYPYAFGDNAPSSEPQVLATFPDYGLGYKYGGWHLTRTVVFSDKGKLYVSVGSSCNACEEKEEVRGIL